MFPALPFWVTNAAGARASVQKLQHNAILEDGNFAEALLLGAGLLAGLGGFAAFLALLDGSYAQAAASAIVALLLCPFAVPMLLSLAGSALIVAASAIFAWLF